MGDKAPLTGRHVPMVWRPSSFGRHDRDSDRHAAYRRHNADRQRREAQRERAGDSLIPHLPTTPVGVGAGDE